jgi:hypothetical protein
MTMVEPSTAEAISCSAAALRVKDSSHESSSSSTATSGSNASTTSLSSSGISLRCSIVEMTPTSVVFDSFGILEYILCYSEAVDLLAATQVNRRWKEAGRTDSLWEGATERLWRHKIGAPFQQPQAQQGRNGSRAAGSSPSSSSPSSSPPLLFWRSLFTKDAVRRMTAAQIRTIFQHPLLSEKRDLLDKKHITEKADLQRFLQVHMLDVMSDGPEWHHFFSDICFGSYTCSVMDSKRDSITPLELCTPSGFDMYFKIATDDVDDADRSFLTTYDEEGGNGNILLYHHSTCFFEESREFSIVLKQYVQSYHPTDLRWRWLDVGKRLQVGPYPPLAVSRRKDWGWKLENLHVVLLFRA